MKKLTKSLLLLYINLIFQLHIAIGQEVVDLGRVDFFTNINIDFSILHLKKNEVAEIHYWGTGCHMPKPLERKITFTKAEDSFLITYCTLSKSLTLTELEPILEQFKKSLEKMDASGRCTSISKILAKLPHGDYISIDKSCQWKGYESLIKSIFEVKSTKKFGETCN